MRAFSSANEVRAALRKRAEWRRLTQAHSIFSHNCYFFTRRPLLFKVEMISQRILDVSQMLQSLRNARRAIHKIATANIAKLPELLTQMTIEDFRSSRSA